MIFELDDTEIEIIETAYQNPVSENEDEELQDEQEDVDNSGKHVDPFGITKHLLIKKDYNERFYVHLLNENGEVISDDIKDDIGEKAFEKVCELIPRFVYYSEYGNLDS